MNFQRICLRHFRNYSHLELEIPPGVVVITGKNGQGKTNFIESLYVLLRGESFRPSMPETFLQFNEQNPAAGCRIEALIEQNSFQHELEWTFSGQRKSHRWNRKVTTAATLARQFPIVLFSPESLGAIKEGPDSRRQLIDDALATHLPAGPKVLKDFRKCLRMRNRLLSDFKSGRTSDLTTHRLLDSLDPIFLPLATEVSLCRMQVLQGIQDDFALALRSVLKTEVDISVDYVVSGENRMGSPRADLISAMHQRAAELRRAEMESGRSLVGPQRHDIRFLFAGNDSRYFCSQGQQRSLILSFKMAQIMYHYKTHQVHPLLLLDDVLSELDAEKRSQLVCFLKGIPSQIFLTTTDLSFPLDFGDRNLSVFRIEKGVLISATNANTRFSRDSDAEL